MGRKLVLTVVCLLCLASSAAAASDGALGLKLGYVGPIGDFKDAADGAFGYGIYGQRNLGKNFAVQFSYLRHKHQLGDDSVIFGQDQLELDIPSITSKKVTINDFVLNGTYTFNTSYVKPYLLGGIGVYLWDVEVKGNTVDSVGRLSSASNSKTSTDIGVNLGGGLHYMFTPNFSFGAEAVYTYVSGDFDEGFYSVLATLSIWP